MSEISGFHIQTIVILAIFALVFAILYFSNRRHPFSGWVAIAYSAALIGYLIDSTRTSSTPIGLIFISASMFWIFCLAIAKAVYVRCNAAFPNMLASMIVAFSILSFILLTLVAPDISMRSMLVSSVAGILLALSLPPLWKAADQLIDSALFGVIATVAVTFIARLLIVYFLLDLTLTERAYSESTHAWIFHFTSGICALALAVILLFAAGHEMVLHFHAQSNLDPLTGLLNRRGLKGVFNAEFIQNETTSFTRSIIIFDVDHFKQVNDRYGHMVGDKVLQRIAKTASDLCAEYGQVARTGGEEFVILSNWMPAETAEFLAQNVCDSLGLLVHPELESNHRVTASFGLALLTDADSLHDAMDRADKALYLAKGNGRNQVALAEAA